MHELLGLVYSGPNLPSTLQYDFPHCARYDSSPFISNTLLCDRSTICIYWVTRARGDAGPACLPRVASKLVRCSKTNSS